MASERRAVGPLAARGRPQARSNLSAAAQIPHPRVGSVEQTQRQASRPGARRRPSPQKNSFSPNWMIRIGVRRPRISPMRAPSGVVESVRVKLMPFGVEK